VVNYRARNSPIASVFKDYRYRTRVKALSWRRPSIILQLPSWVLPDVNLPALAMLARGDYHNFAPRIMKLPSSPSSYQERGLYQFPTSNQRVFSPPDEKSV
jgi:hypothetical protein